MAECALSFLGETIGNLFTDEAKFLCGVKGKVDELRNELEWTWAKLRDIDESRQHDQNVESWVMKLQNIAYEADDVIDEYDLRITPEEDENIMQAYADFVSKCTCVRVHTMGTKIENLKSRISEHKMREPKKRPAKASTPMPTYAFFPEDFVGRKDDINKLVERLLNGKEHRVISIWGMDGLGKSALAKKVFNHDKVQKHFEGFAWVCMSGECEAKEILRTILKNLIPDPDKKREINEMGQDELLLKTLQTQEKKKCIVVLDDIRTNQAWDNLCQAFPLNNMASKLLITTHNREVTEHIYQQAFLHQAQCLTDDESWELLKMRACPKTEEISENIKELGGKLLKKCGGLPSAVIALGKLLADKKQNMINSNINSLFSDKISEMLALSYYDLPWHKKQCFLYLCSFPTDEEIPVAKVILMWIAEGFVLPNANAKESTVENEAEKYLLEFSNKGLVQVRLTLSGKIKTCRLCEPVQNFCISKAMQETFLSILNIQHGDEVKSSCPTRRLSLHVHGSVEGNTIPKLNQIGSTMLNLRTFMFFHSGGLVKGTWRQFQPIFDKCKFLRVLTLEDLSSMGENLPESVGDLVHLRYLSLARSVIEGLPQSMGNLVYMEFLDLHLRGVVVIPDMLWKMRRLRYLHLPNRFAVHGSKKLQLNSLKHLRTLRNFCPEKCDLNDVGKQTNLQKLTVCKQYGSDKFKIFPQLVKFTLDHLRSSSFRFSSNSFTEDELSKMSNYPHFCKLSIDGEIEKLPGQNYMEKLPGQNYLPRRLRKLVLLDSQLKEDPMPILEKLQDLVVLLLRRAFKGKKMVCTARGFPQLKHLVLDNLPNLKEWMVFQGAMPHLSRLGISDCPSLKTPPQGDYTYYDSEDIGHELYKFVIRADIFLGGEKEDEEQGKSTETLCRRRKE